MDMKKLKKNVEAVSPVIATLMLVIVAVAAAAVFFTWQSNWQEGLTDDVETTTTDIFEGINQDAAQKTLTFSGSTTVGPCIQDAIPAFESAYPLIDADVISLPGSSTGISNVESGICNIGMASKPLSEEEYESGLIAHTIGYDGVVVAYSPGCIHADIDDNKAGYNFSDDDFTADEMKAYLGDSSKNATFWYRGDGSGTEETFCKKLSGTGVSSVPDMLSATPPLLNGTSIGTVGSNAAMVDKLNDGTAKNIGFISYGFSIDQDMNVLTFDTVAASEATIKDQTYGGSRPLNLVTAGVPDEVENTFISWIQDNEDINNQYLHAWDYVSLYD